MEARLFALQRLTAILLAPLVIIHLLLIFYAVQDGLTAAEILGRTEGSLLWASFYTLFVAAAAVHAPLGLRNVLIEWTRLKRYTVDRLMIGFAILLFALGLRAVVAVTL
ncbi:MAG: succinate dehydrogenase [Geminicoccaceae bacterium]